MDNFDEKETKLLQRLFEVHPFQDLENAKTAKSILLKMGDKNPRVFTGDEGFCVTDPKSKHLADLRDMGANPQEVA